MKRAWKIKDVWKYFVNWFVKGNDHTIGAISNILAIAEKIYGNHLLKYVPQVFA